MRRPFPLCAALFVVGVFTVASCGTSGSSSGAGDVAGDVGADGVAADTIAFDTPVLDVGDADEADGDVEDADASGNDFGRECRDDSECASGYCIDTDAGRVCTALCQDSCPDGFDCRLIVNSGGDAARICVPEIELLCAACRDHRDCEPVGVCVDLADGSFCLPFCGEGDACESEFACASVLVAGFDPGGAQTPVDVCEPSSGECVGRALSSVRPTATGRLVVEGEGERLRLRGRIGPLDYVGVGERFRLVGGF